MIVFAYIFISQGKDISRTKPKHGTSWNIWRLTKMISYPQPPSWVQARDPLYIIFNDIFCSGQVAQKGGEACRD